MPPLSPAQVTFTRFVLAASHVALSRLRFRQPKRARGRHVRARSPVPFAHRSHDTSWFHAATFASASDVSPVHPHRSPTVHTIRRGFTPPLSPAQVTFTRSPASFAHRSRETSRFHATASAPRGSVIRLATASQRRAFAKAWNGAPTSVASPPDPSASRVSFTPRSPRRAFTGSYSSESPSNSRGTRARGPS